MDPRFDGEDGGEIVEMRELDGIGTLVATPIADKRKFFPVWNGYSEKDDNEVVRHFTVINYDPTRIDGLGMEYVSATGIRINPGFCTDSSGTSLISLASAVTIDVTVSGVGGMASGVSFVSGTSYAPIVIGDKFGIKPTSVILADQATYTAPSLPPGYNIFRRVGWTRTYPSSAAFLKFIQTLDGRDRFIWYDEESANLIALSGGNATAWTPVALGNWVPPTARMINIKLSYSPNVAATRYARIRPTGSTVVLPVTQIDTNQNITTANWFITVTGPSQQLDYEIAAITGSLDIWVAGYWDCP
jgi:hypothetical protein